MTLGPAAPDLASLDLLVDVVQLGSISSAAATAGISQPSASARLRKLERQLGVTLLDRSPGGSQPTDTGRLVAQWAAEIVAAADRLRAGVEALRPEIGQVLHLAASFTIAEVLLPTWLATLRSTHPTVRTALEVKNSTDVEDLVHRGIVQLGFIEGPTLPRPLRTAVITDDELVVVVPPHHPWVRRRQPLSAAELASEPLVVREPGSGTRESLLAALQTAGINDVQIAMEAGSTTSVLRAVTDGVGPTVISRLAVAAEIHSGQLHEIPVADLPLRRQLRAIWSHTRPLSPTAATLLRIAHG